MNVVSKEQCARPAQAVESLFVSSILSTWKTANPDRLARDCQIDETAFRRLDPEYYAWLRSRMTLAQKAAAAGNLPAAAFEDLRIRFNSVHDWAIERFGEAPLVAAVRALRAGEYRPPVPRDEGEPVRLPRAARSAGDHISTEAVATVDAIAEKAMALGWSRDRLYAVGKGLFDPERGLVGHLKPGEQIGEVTAQSIEIILPPPSEVHHRFYNPDVDQPWIVRVAAEKK
jgi:hypothetical protein